MAEIRRKAASLPEDLIHTKLAPPRLHGALLPRAPLLARLDQGLARKLTLLAAPAGFGKTTLVAAWLATRHLPAAWVSLDGGDNDPLRFWRYVITACQSFAPDAGRPSLATLTTSQQPSYEAVLTAFINEMARLSGQSVLVLEDYHTITSREVAGTLAFLLEHFPPTLHLVLMARGEPELPLARLRAQNELNELGAEDLRFTPEETRTFLQETLHLSLSPAAVTRLAEKTEGWAAGLRLAALALEGKPQPPEAERYLAMFGGGHRHVVEYLTAEVLAAQPEPIQAFLLRTSLLARLTGSLCDAVTGREDGEAVLEALQRAGLFLIPLAGQDEQAWYRYHGLFAEAMRHNARHRLAADDVKATYEKASRWFEEQDLLADAIDMAIAAGAFPRAVMLIERFVERRGLAEPYTLRRWAERLPEPELYRHPSICFNYAMAVLFTVDRYAPATAITIERLLGVAEDAWRAGEDTAGLGQILALRAVVTLWQGERTQSFALSRAALQLLPVHEALWRSVSLSNVAYEELLAGHIDATLGLTLEAHALGQVAQNVHVVLLTRRLRGELSYYQGDLDQAYQHYQNVLAGAVGGEEMLDDQAAALLGLGAIAYERDELAVAETHASQALRLAEQRHEEDGRVHAGLLLARVLHARGQAGRALEQLRAPAAHTSRRSLLDEIEAWQARFALAAGDVAAALQWSAAVTVRPEHAPLLQQERQALVVARLQIATGEVDAALEKLAGWRTDARREGRTRSELEILILEALARYARSDRPQAEQALIAALALGRPGGFRRVFLDEGEPIAALLQAALPHISKRPLAIYAAGLLRSFQPEWRSPAPSPLVEPLSAQEGRVLRLLVAGLSNPEIARELVVSVNTIKTQVKSIYRKLDVNDRNEARVAARELNLL